MRTPISKKTDEEWNLLMAAKIHRRIARHTRFHGTCTIPPGEIMEWRDPDGRMTGVDGKDYPKNYEYGGILRDYWMEKLEGSIDYFAPKTKVDVEDM